MFQERSEQEGVSTKRMRRELILPLGTEEIRAGRDSLSSKRTGIKEARVGKEKER